MSRINVDHLWNCEIWTDNLTQKLSSQASIIFTIFLKIFSMVTQWLRGESLNIAMHCLQTYVLLLLHYFFDSIALREWCSLTGAGAVFRSQEKIWVSYCPYIKDDLLGKLWLRCWGLKSNSKIFNIDSFVASRLCSTCFSCSFSFFSSWFSDIWWYDD